MEKIRQNDIEFDSLFKEEYRKHSAVHWTTIATIEKCIQFLSRTESKSLLDIGSGIGKFCIKGAELTKIQFTGVEIRENLYLESIRVMEQKGLENITFINDDIVHIDFLPFDAFYYYNPFAEHIAINDKIDDLDSHSEEKYYEYEEIILKKLESTKIGSNVILHYAKTLFLSENFRLVDIEQKGDLTFWVKEK